MFLVNDKTFLIEENTHAVINFLIEDEKLSASEAISKFFTSTTFEKLCDTETGLYLFSPAYIYELFRDELQYAHFGHIQDQACHE